MSGTPQRWKVTVPLRVEGTATAIELYAAGLQAHLEQACPRYQPTMVIGAPERATSTSGSGLFAVFSNVEGSEATAIGRAVYWLGRGVQRERSLPWRGGIRMVERDEVEAVLDGE